jgi:hypothetical protein
VTLALPLAGQEVTFSRDVAPILYRACVPCHRAEGAGPFPLFTFGDVRKRALDLVRVTERRLMPPWLPEPGHGVFRDARRLSDEEIKLLRRWVESGVVEGLAQDLPPAPVFAGQWQLGRPDLEVTLPVPYLLAAEGPDVNRNFVIPLPLQGNRFVRALEVLPSSRSLHHARLMFDTTSQCRRLDEADAEVGFGGMRVPARFPPGQLVTWVPGRQADRGSEEFSWSLEAGSDLILQAHMQRTGRPEQLQVRIGFHFTEHPPRQQPFLLGLLARDLDIPAGATNHAVRRVFELPVAVDLLSIMPHAHYLAREVRGAARLPDGSERALLWIRRWDFNWQDQYRYLEPVALPAGAQLVFDMSFDNSTNNVRNPRSPPARARYGPQTTDEMAELWFQLLPRSADGWEALDRGAQAFAAGEAVRYYSLAARVEPGSAGVRLELAKALGVLGRTEEAFPHLLEALDLDPELWEAHHYVGVYFLERKLWPAAREAFEGALRRNPRSYRSLAALADAALAEGRREEAERWLEQAMRVRPGDKQLAERLREVRSGR